MIYYRLQTPSNNSDPSLMECMAYSVVVPSDPLNCDDQIYSDIQTDIIDPKPSTMEIVPSDHPNSDNLDRSGSSISIKSVLLRTESSIKYIRC